MSNSQQPVFKKAFTIPKKRRREDEEASTSAAELLPKAELKKIDKSSPDFEKFTNIVKRNFAETGPPKQQIHIPSIEVIENGYLNKKHDDFKKATYTKGMNTKEVHVFLAVRDMEEAKKIADEGLSVKNTFFSDLGTNEDGVYVFRHPDMMLPHPFYLKRTVLGVCFKITAARTNWHRVGLNSTELRPTPFTIAHQANASQERQLNRLEKYRYDQLYVYDLSNGKAAEQPASLVPYFIFEMTTVPGAKSYGDFIRPEVTWNKFHRWQAEGIFAGEILQLSCIPHYLPKPWGFDKTVTFKEQLNLEDFVQHPVVEALLAKPYWGDLLTTKLNQKITIQGTTFWYIIMKVGSKKASEKYKKIVEALQRKQKVLYTEVQMDLVEFFLLPSTETTLRLGLPYLAKEEMYGLMIRTNNSGSPFDYGIDVVNSIQEESTRQGRMMYNEDQWNIERDAHYRDRLETQSMESTRFLKGFEPAQPPVVLRPVTSLDDFSLDEESQDPPNGYLFFFVDDCKKKSLLKKPKSLKEQAIHDNDIKRRVKTTRLNWKDHHGGELDDAGLWKRRQEDRHDYKQLNAIFSDKKMSEEDLEANEANMSTVQTERAKTNALFQAALSGKNNLADLDLDAELAPIVFPEDPGEKAKKIIENRKSVLNMPMPTFGKDKTKENPPEVQDVEMDESSLEKPEESVETADKTADTTFEDPADIDYDVMLLGPSGSVEEAEPMETEEPEKEKEKTPEPAPAPALAPNSALNGFLKMFNMAEPYGVRSSSPAPRDGSPTPTAPASPPASPPTTSTEDLQRILNSLKAKKGETAAQDMDLRLVSQPKIIPLVGKVSMSLLNKEQTTPMQKIQLAAFKPDEEEEVSTQDKDERSKEKPKDRDERSRDKDDRERGRDKDERDRDDRRSYDRRDRDRRDRDRDRRDRDYDRRDRDRRDRDRRDYRDRDMRERRSSQEDTRPGPIPEKSDTDDRILKIPSPVTASQAGIHLIGQAPAAPSFIAPNHLICQAASFVSPKPVSPDPASPPASPEPEGSSRASKFVNIIPTDKGVEASEPEDGEIPDSQPTTSQRTFKEYMSQVRLPPPGLHHLPATIQHIPVQTPLPNFHLPPPNMSIPPPIINRHFAGLQPGSAITGPYAPGFPMKFSRPPPARGFAPVPVRQQNDAIFILLDDFIMRIPTFDSSKLTELLNKLDQYQKVYHIPCVLQIHATTEKNLRNLTMSKATPAAFTAKVQSYLDVLLQFSHLHIVQPQPHHHCDDESGRQAVVQCQCIRDAAIRIRSQYPMAKIIYFSDMAVKEPSFLHEMRVHCVQQMSIKTIMDFDRP